MTYTEIKIKIDNLGQQVEEQGGVNSAQLQKLYQKFRLECDFNSTRLEGNTLGVEEVRSMISGMVHVENKPLKDLMEIKNHDEVLREMLGGGLVEVHLSEKYIKDLHAKLMYEEDAEKKKLLGQWKQVSNGMTTYKGDRYSFVRVEEVKAEMKELINRTNEAIDYILKGKKYAPHPIDVALNFHIDFLKISPFDKGNGIIARMLSNQLLIAFVYTPFWITAKEHQAYEQYIADILCYDGAKDELFSHMAQQILRSQQMIVDIQDGKSIEESQKFYNQIELLRQQLKAKEEEKSKVKSEEWLEEIFAHSIRPLFTEVENNVKENFGDLFEEIKSRYTLQSLVEETTEEEELLHTEIEENETEVSSIDEIAKEQLVDEIVEEEVAEVETEISLAEEAVEQLEDESSEFDLDNPTVSWNGVEHIQSSILLDGFKLIEGADAIQVDLLCEFTTLTYVIDLGDDLLFEKEYDQKLEDTEIKAISDYISEAIVKKINLM